MKPPARQGRRTVLPAALAALGLTAAAGAVAAGFDMKSYVTVSANRQEAAAWCDAPQAIIALTVPTNSGPDKAAPVRATLLQWQKSRAGLAQPTQNTVVVGRPEPGAGQIYQPLTVTSGPRRGQSGFLHTSNIENTNDPAYRMTRTVEFKLANDVYTCRYVKDATFIGVTGKRTVIIWSNLNGVTMATRNFDGSAGLYFTDGTMEHDDLGPAYLFGAPSGFSSIVKYDERVNFIQILRDDKVLSTEYFLAYSASVPRQ